FENPKFSLGKIYSFLAATEQYPSDLNARNVGQYQSDINPRTVAKLRTYFKEDVVMLHDLTGREFIWSGHYA
ncbi:MAG: hypothetical protein AAFN65_09480, partial [Bacteroidota bacterium]